MKPCTISVEKVMGLLAPGMFRKQNQRFLDNFKAFCEASGDGRHEPATEQSQ